SVTTLPDVALVRTGTMSRHRSRAVFRPLTTVFSLGSGGLQVPECLLGLPKRLRHLIDEADDDGHIHTTAGGCHGLILQIVIGS
ncbi:hypothetical protein ACO1L7_14515, partial [Staphylococcus aureus]